MTQTKTSKRALLTSALSLLLCCTMLIGTTWAWFTDSVTSAGNKIQSGTLKVDLLVKGGNTGVGLDEDYVSVKTGELANKPIFDYDLWEPGYTLVTYAKVVNEGNLALKYTLNLVSADNIADAELAEVIDVYYAPSEVTGIDTRAGFNTAVANGTIAKLDTLKNVFAGGGALTVNDNLEPNGKGNYEDYATIVLKMQETAGNEYQNKTIPAFDICLLATQWTYERDSFDDQYDARADYIKRTTVSIGGSDYSVSETFSDSLGTAWDDGALGYNDKITVTVAVPDDLVALSKMISLSGWIGGDGAYMLTMDITNDLDFSGVAWTPIGGRASLTINGNGHTISNLSNSLFGYVGYTFVNDLTLENVTATGAQVGAFAGSVEGFYLTNCTLAGNVNISYSDTGDAWRAIGALVGWNEGVTFNNVKIADNTVITMDATDITVDHGNPSKLTYDTYVGTGTYTGVTVGGNVTVNYTHP